MNRQRASEPRLRMNARLVREQDRAKSRDLRLFMLYGAAIVLPLLVYVWQRIEFIRISYRVEELQKQKQDLGEANKRIAVERSLLMSPERIERVARQQLGLVDPHSEDVRRVAVDGGGQGEIGGPVTALPSDGGAPAGGASPADAASSAPAKPPARRATRPPARRPARRYVAASVGALPLPPPLPPPREEAP